MKYYSKSTMQNWKKEELIERIEYLQHILQCEENLNNRMLNTIMAVSKKDPAFSSAVGEVRDIWNKCYGTRYEEIE